MTARTTIALAIAAGALCACHDSSTIPHTPTTLVVVSGNNQSADLSSPLDSSLVVRVTDGAGKAVAGVPLAWSVSGGGSLSATSTTTDNSGQSSVKWTLGPAVATQIATVTSTKIALASVSFVAGNGATITGSVTPAAINPFAATFSRRAPRVGFTRTAATPARMPRASNRIVIGFRSDAMGLATQASAAYRSLSVARDAASRIRARTTALAALRGLRPAEISPAILAARVTVDDTTRMASIMDQLRAEPDVRYVEREQTITIRDGAPRARVADFSQLAPYAASHGDPDPPAGKAAVKVPVDTFYYYQQWTSNMLDLPRAWALTTGSVNVTVASVDMGIRFEHPSTAPNLTSDGYDFVTGLAFDSTQTFCDGGTFTTTAGDGDGPDPDPTDPDDIGFDPFDNCWVHLSAGDHGLWTAGIIGAIGNQNLGVAGVNWSVRIRPIRVLDVTGSGTFFDIAQGVLYAAGLPAVGAGGNMVQTTRAQIINMSLGGGFNDPSLADAVAAAENAGTLIVASAGNDGLDDLVPTYPAAYPGVMAVAAVGMDGALATYSNAGTYISVAAPGGDFRLDDNGGGAVIGPGWDFSSSRPNFILGYGTSAAAPFVSGIAALLLSQNPNLSATDLRTRIEQFATRPAGSTRSDSYGWGIVNAFNALTSTQGPARTSIARLVDATVGSVVRTAHAGSDGSFAFAKLATGSYYLQAGEDEDGDGAIGLPGRRFAWAGGAGSPTVFNVNGDAHTAAISLGLPLEVEPNDGIAHANLLAVGSYVIGDITTPDTRDVYRVPIPSTGTYTFETSGLLGACGLGIELNTIITVTSATGGSVGSSDNAGIVGNPLCSRVRATVIQGIYYVTVTGSSSSFFASHGRYRLQVRSGN